MTSENAKNPNWKAPVDLPGVKPTDYQSHIDSANGSAASKSDTQDGTKGFSPQLSGHGKADHAGTSSFDAGPPKYKTPGYSCGKETVGQEEGGRNRQPTTSAVARAGKKE